MPRKKTMQTQPQPSSEANARALRARAKAFSRHYKGYLKVKDNSQAVFEDIYAALRAAGMSVKLPAEASAATLTLQ